MAQLFFSVSTPEEIAESDRLAGLSAKEVAELSSPQQLAQQTCELRFQIAMKAVTIVRYLSDHVTQ